VTVEGRRRSPLHGREDDLRILGGHELAFLGQVSLRLADPEEALVLPTAPNTWTSASGRELLWLGPDEWLVVGDGDAAETASWLEATMPDGRRSIVDVSANRAAIELEGSSRLELLAQGCGLDLHPRSWRAGRCAQTLLARVPVLLQERERATRVFVRPSFAGWLVDWALVVAGSGERG
jgi:sarcosine oxidase subunit gamma